MGAELAKWQFAQDRTVERLSMGNGIRHRTSLVKSRKARRCPKCGSALNNQRKRCKACHKKVA
jgi:hypothetical protein